MKKIIFLLIAGLICDNSFSQSITSPATGLPIVSRAGFSFVVYRP